MSDVNDIPVWDDCPFKDKLPPHITVRRGVVEGFPETIVVLHAKIGSGEWHVDLFNIGKDADFDREIKPSIVNLGGAIFEHERPGEYARLLKGLKKDSRDEMLWARLEELGAA